MKPLPSRSLPTIVPALFAAAALCAGSAAAHPGLDPDERAARIEQRSARLQQELALTDAQAAQLQQLFIQQREQRAAAREALRAERDALRSLVEGGAPDAAVAKQLAKVKAAQAALPARGAVLDQAAKSSALRLTPTQQAKLLLMKGDRGKRGKHMQRR